MQFNASDGKRFITCLISKNYLEGITLEENDIVQISNFKVRELGNEAVPVIIIKDKLHIVKKASIDFL